MLHQKKNYSKNKVILGIIFSITIISSATYLFIQNKNKKNKSKIQAFSFSRPDNRPDKIIGKTVTLKRFHPNYLKEYYQKINYPEIIKPFKLPEKLTLKFIESDLNYRLMQEKAGKTFYYIIFNNKNNEIIGSLEIRDPNPRDPGQFTCWLTPKYWGKGKLQEAFKLLVNAYFKLKPNVKKFNAHVEMWNLRSYYGLKKCGFKFIKILHFKDQPSRYYLEYYNPNQKKEN